MKKLSLLAAPAVMLAASSSAFAMSSFTDWCLTPYAGVDAQIRHMALKDNFGGKQTVKNYPQGNFFAGLKVNDYLGIEVGYETTQRKSRNTTNGDLVSVFNVPNQSHIVFAPLLIDGVFPVTTTDSVSSRIQGFNASLMGYFPICDEYCLQLIGGVGVARLRANIKHTVKTSTAVIVSPLLPDPITETTEQNSVTTFKKTKTVVRVMGGLQHMISDCAGVRGTVTWENTSRLSINGVETPPSATTPMAKLKDSVIYGVGVFMQF